MLSLSPRYDLFRFSFPKDFLPKDLEEKYQKLFITDSAVISSPINYLNESIVGVTFPGISDRPDATSAPPGPQLSQAVPG